MIEDFRQETTETILKFLKQLGNDPQMYVRHTVGLGPLIQDRDVYLFANDEDVVIVALDPGMEGRYELADEEPFGGERPLYFSETSHRVSPVLLLAVTCELLRNRLSRFEFHQPRVWGVLLTTSTLINRDDMKEAWDTLNVTVIDNMRGLDTLQLADHTDAHLPLTFPLESFLKTRFSTEEIESAELGLYMLMGVTTSSDPEESADSPEDIIKAFSWDAYENWATGSGDDDSDDSSELEDSNDVKDDGLHFTSGFIQQNNNTQVKVKVLQPLANPREELDKLVGCETVKTRMDELVQMTRYNRLMRYYNPGGKQHKLSLHCVFFGRPGTGKSTVARILGSLLKDAGVLSKGHVVVCNRGTFVGTNWGDEERSVNQVVELARGGVLMIDEAYLLSTQHPNDPGKLVIQLLMDLLADESDRDLAVVLCGYKDEMQNLLNLNPGLDSRFSNRFEFADFNVDELMEISRRRVCEFGYHFTRAAWQKLRTVVCEAYDHRDKKNWGNARFIANLLEKIYTRHAIRCVGQSRMDRKRLLCLTPADIVPFDQSQSHLPVSEPQPDRIHVSGFRRV